MDDLKLGWLSPTGSLYECNTEEHIHLARDLMDTIRTHLTATHQTNKLSKKDDPEDALLDMGWVKIGISLLGKKEWRIYWDNQLTPEQIRFLRPYFENEDTLPMPPYILRKWEQQIE